MHQYDIFLSGRRFQSYSVYKSSTGGKALLLSALHAVSPWPPAVDLHNFRGLVALLLAVSISLFIAWLDYEFGAVTALFVPATTLVSQWITLYGRNLFYFIWTSFVPLAAMAWYLARSTSKARMRDWRLTGVAFLGILLKCVVSGYDFIIPALSMPLAPLAYYAVRDHWPLARFIRQSSLLLLGMAAAVGVSIASCSTRLIFSLSSFVMRISRLLRC